MAKSEKVVFNGFDAKSDGGLAYIDMLRGFAILGVLLVHSLMGAGAAGLNKLPVHLEWLLLAGKHGVTLFFVVSAFTLMRSMHIRIDEEHMPIKKYFVRRFFRIAPAYYLILIIVFIFYGAGFPGYTNPQDATLTWPDLVTHMSFVNSLFPFYTNDFLGVEWSVSTEFMFYVLLPFIFLWLHKTSTTNQAIIKIGILYLVSIALYWLMFFKGGYFQALGGSFASQVFSAWSYFFIATHLQAFIVGVAMWLFIQLKECSHHLAPQPQTKLVLAGLVCLGIAGAYVESYKSNDVYIVWGGLIFWGLLSGALINVLDLLRPANVAGLRVLTGLGKVSFSLYLVHFPVFYGLSKFTDVWRITQIPEVNFLLYEIVAFGLAYLLARMLFHSVEKPGMELGRVLLKRFPTQKNILTEGVL